MQESILLDDTQQEFHFVETKQRGLDWTKILLSLILVSGLCIGGLGLYHQMHESPASDNGIGQLGAGNGIGFGWQCRIHLGNIDEADCTTVATGMMADMGCPAGFTFHSIMDVHPKKNVDKETVEQVCNEKWVEEPGKNGCHFNVHEDVWHDVDPNAPVDEPVEEDPVELELQNKKGLKVHYFCKVAPEEMGLVLTKPLSCNTCQIIPDVADYCLCKTCKADTGDDVKITCPADKPTMRILSVKTGHHSDGNNIALVYNNCKENWETLEGASPSCTINLDELMGVEDEEDFTDNPPLSRPPFGPGPGGPHRPPFPMDWVDHDSVQIKYFCEA